jgi:hypothetical protein
MLEGRVKAIFGPGITKYNPKFLCLDVIGKAQAFYKKKGAKDCWVHKGPVLMKGNKTMHRIILAKFDNDKPILQGKECFFNFQQ